MLGYLDLVYIKSENICICYDGIMVEKHKSVLHVDVLGVVHLCIATVFSVFKHLFA
jgi:hypothetical protein